MAITHTTAATGGDSAGLIGETAWNENHTVTGLVELGSTVVQGDNDITQITDTAANNILLISTGVGGITAGGSIQVSSNSVYFTGVGTAPVLQFNGFDQVIGLVPPLFDTYEYGSLLFDAQNDGLTPEAYYRITDFQTVHYTSNGDLTTEITTGPTEVLLVRARTVNDIYPRVYSETYPDDEIEYVLLHYTSNGTNFVYDTVINDCPGFKGWITRRVDNARQIDAPFDWRVCETKLYLEAATGDQYTNRYKWAVDVNGSALFKMVQTTGACASIKVTHQPSWAIPPIIFTTATGNIDKVTVNMSMDQLIFHGTTMDTHIGSCCTVNIWGDCIDTQIYGVAGVYIKGSVNQCVFHPGQYHLGINDTTVPLSLIGCTFNGGGTLNDSASPWAGDRTGVTIGSIPQFHQVPNEGQWSVRDSFEDTKFVDVVSGTEGAYNGELNLRAQNIYIRGVALTGNKTLNFVDFTSIIGLADIPSIDASGFNGNLATTDDTIQDLAQKVDDLVLGGVVGTDTQIPYNNNGTMAGTANLIYKDTNQHLEVGLAAGQGAICLPANTSDEVAEAGELIIYAKSIANRVMPKWVGPSGIDTPFQAFLGMNGIYMVRFTGTTASTLGGAAPSATGTLTAPTMSATTLFGSMSRGEYRVTTAATTAVGGFRQATAVYHRGSATGRGGFFFVARFGVSHGAATSTMRCYTGMCSSTSAPTDAEPSAQTQHVGVGWDAADSSIQIMHNAASTTTKVSLNTASGASNFNVPTSDAAAMYEIVLFCKPNDTVVYYRFTNLTTAATYSGNVSTNLPTNTTFLAPRGYASVGGTSSVIGYALASLYIESDY